MNINEIFYSIQGEGSWSGYPNIFIRTTGCNLRCIYCDTQYAYENGVEMTIQEILRNIKKYPCSFICLTGGEPLLQNDTLKLVDTLIENNYSICIETNGSQAIDSLTKKQSVMISLDIKCPSSRMHTKMKTENISRLRTQDQLKFIIQNRQDYEFAKKILKQLPPKCSVFFQPVWNTNPVSLAKWILDDGLPVQLGVQLHKIIYGEKKGV